MTVTLGPNIPVMVRGDLGDAYLAQGNAFLRMFQALIQPEVLSVALTAPPGSPVNGDRYIVATGGTGLWATHDKAIAVWTTDDPAAPSGKWEFYTPLHGWMAFNQANDVLYIYSGTAWIPFGVGGLITAADPSYAVIREEFSGGGVTNLAVGQLGWAIFNTNGVTLQAGQGSAYGFPASGMIKINNSATAAGFNNVNLSPGAGNGNAWMPLFDYPGWKATFIFGLAPGDGDRLAPYFTKKSIYVGLGAMQIDNAWPARPRIFCGLRYDTDTTAPTINDSTFKFEVVANLTNATNTARSNTQGTVIDTGVAPAMGLYRLDIQSTAIGVVTMSLNGSTPQAFTIPTITCGTGVDNGTGDVTSNVGRYAPGTAVTVFNVNSFTAGSLVTLAGLTGAISVLNGARVVMDVLQSAQSIKFPIVNADVILTNSVGTVTGRPAVVPLFSFGNDTTAAPTANSLAILLDFFSLVWNKSIASPSFAVNAALPRYT